MGRAPEGASVRVDVLGPLRLAVDGGPVDVRGPKRRAVLALLALAEGRTVTVEQVVDALWPDDPPESARATVHSHVSRLRTDLRAAAPRLTTDEGGYRLALDDDGLDLRRVRTLLDRARDLVTADPAAAAALLREARAAWRGPALADLAEVPPLRAAADAARELWRDVTDRLAAALVAAGAAGEALGPAAEAVEDDPLREPAVLLLVRALSATGQAPRALRTAREFRARLAEETGLDPSPALAALESDVAAGAAGPVAVPVPPPAPRPTPEPATKPLDLHGRDDELAAVGRLLATERLVSVVGTGGVGKTRIAREVARREPGAATLLLAPVTDPGAVPHALAAALHLGSVAGDVLTACLDVLAGAPRLLVVDNCEHLLDAARDLVAALLEHCPDLVVLTTTREPLGLGEEVVVRLAPLPVPGPGDARGADGALSAVPSVAVFLDRAARVRRDLHPDELPHVARIVRHLEGLPLAIELAAGRLSTFAPAALAARLDRSLDLLGSRGLHERHRTLRSTVAWSYDLLGDDEQRLFRHLSVFADGVDLTAVERVVAELGLGDDAGSVLARLVDASMVDAVDEPPRRAGGSPGRTRYRMLETLRAYGRDRLVAAGEDDAADGRLVRWAVDLAEWVQRTAHSADEAAADAVLRREHGNLRAAWRQARERGDLDAAVAVATALVEPAYWRDLVEIRGWCAELADDPALAGHPREGEVYGAASQDAYISGDAPRARRLARAGLERVPPQGVHRGRELCLSGLAQAELTLGAWADAVTHDLAALDAASPPASEPTVGALAALYDGDVRRARELAALIPARDVPSLRGLAAYVVAEIDSVEGHADAAEERYETAIACARTVGSTFLDAIAAVGLASLRSRMGHLGPALAGYREVIDHWAEGGNWGHLWVTLRNLAELLRALDDGETADLLDAAADRAPDAPEGPRGPGRVPPEEAPDRERALVLARTAIARHLAGRDSAVHAR